MDSIQRGLREGSIRKDTYERLICTECDEQLKTRNDPEELFSLRFCPECGREFKKLG